jgi:hypothetical protein
MSALIGQWDCWEVSNEQRNEFKHKCMSGYGRRNSIRSVRCYSTSNEIMIPSSRTFYCSRFFLGMFLSDGTGTRAIKRVPSVSLYYTVSIV